MSESTSPEAAMPASTATTAPLLEVRDLAVSFSNSSDPTGPRIQAVAGVSMTIHPRQTLAVVGESGCGKSVTAMSSMQLIPRPPGRFDRGSIRFRGDDVLQYDESRMLQLRGKDIAMIFQEPMTSLNPVYTIGDQIMEAVLLHQDVSAEDAVEIAVKAMDDVGIPHPAQRLRDYPHQFSGGMRQRVMIAMALACDPTLLLADEPTTALDVTIQAQILELLRELQRTKEMGIMLITHNLGVVAENADVVCVMYAGRVVEYAKVYDLFDRPLHPYTRGLFDSIPRLGQGKHRLTTVEEVVGDPEEFRKLPGHDPAAGVEIVPWWPEPPGDVKPEVVSDDEEYVLYEIEPDRWVGCFRSRHLADHVCRPPDLDFRKDDLL
ncbi:MAG: ABC transporter ATP-binding protein [Planctomycetota bacterium]|nr:ABC transporter ATP-binding protein [Planctomycetota bacterium]MEE2972679.1 ABC transporter ATP-binding protein [Planctomycetota bacterium]